MFASIKSLLSRPKSTGLWLTLIKTTFQILVFFVPSQLAKHYWPKWSYIYGFRIDYFSPTVYLTDLLIIFLFGLWLGQILLSFKKNKSDMRGQKRNLLVIATLSIIAGLNSYFAFSEWLSLYKWIKVAELLFLAWFVAKTPKFNFKEWVLKPLMLSMIVVLGIAVGQLVYQKTIGGPLYLLGERTFSITTPGIATFSFQGRELLRPYSTFPHPNALAGYLGIGFLYFFFDLIKKKNRSTSKSALLISTLVIFVLTISQGAWASLLASLLLTSYIAKRPKKTGQLLIVITITVLFLSLLVPIFSDKILASNNFGETVSHRLQLAKTAGLIVNQYPALGIGNGNFIFGLLNNTESLSESWQLQPVHNIFLLVLSEGGLVLYGIFVALLLWTASKLGTKQSNALIAVYIFIMLTGAADHYWLTLQQTQLTLAVFLGLIYRK